MLFCGYLAGKLELVGSLSEDRSIVFHFELAFLSGIDHVEKVHVSKSVQRLQVFEIYAYAFLGVVNVGDLDLVLGLVDRIVPLELVYFPVYLVKDFSFFFGIEFL